jgi:murein DD-endopeptidase MepM/ murein hydrolase activator NlpD
MKIIFAIGDFLQNLARRPRVFALALVPVAVPLFLAAVGSEPETRPVTTASLLSAPAPHVRYADLTAADEGSLPEHSIILTIESGDTLDSILTAGGLSRGESAQLTSELAKSVDVRRLRPGHMVRFHRTPEGDVDAVQMKVNGWGELSALRAENNLFEVKANAAKVRETDAIVTGYIDTSLYDALRAAGEGPQLVQQLADVFQWDIDFFELRKGDSFSLVVRKRLAGTDVIGYGPIVAARFTHRGTTYEAFRHETADGRAGFYARGGAPLRKQFLRAPLQFSRITSGFSKKRFHPVLNYFRPHYGVDYGAPAGTPVMTTADGVVIEAAFSRGEGNFIRIKHSSRIETSYLHLSRFARGLKRGTKVTQGDVIGYVGMTGLATGPHLDYRVRDNGKWLDPLKLKSITPDPLRGDSLRSFRSDVVRLAPQLTAAPRQPLLAGMLTRRRALF